MSALLTSRQYEAIRGLYDMRASDSVALSSCICKISNDWQEDKHSNQSSRSDMKYLLNDFVARLKPRPTERYHQHF